MQRLLGPEGCPWDREQTKLSLRPYVLEEACEVLDAIDSGSDEELAEELGDLALQIVFQGELARTAGSACSIARLVGALSSPFFRSASASRAVSSDTICPRLPVGSWST